MTNATFLNFTDKPFTGFWDGKPKTFKPGEAVYMPAWLAEHFAKHLANQELIKAGKDSYTSPKNPGQVPEFMEMFRKAFIPEKVDASVERNSVDDEIAKAAEPSMDIVVEQPKHINQGAAAAMAEQDAKIEGPGLAPQIINVPDDEDDTSSFALGTK